MVRRPHRSRSLLSVCAALAILATATLPAHGCPILGACRVPIAFDSGPVENGFPEPAVIFSTIVTVPQATSLSLHFSLFELAGEDTTASFVKVTSMRDGDSALLFETSSWIQTLSETPHFNGETVLLELIAFPGTGTNRVVGDEAWAGIPVSSDPDWLCFERNRFVRGDANFDGALNLSDALMILHTLTYSGMCFPCRDAADANDDGAVDLSDAIAVLGHLFLGSAPIPPPFPPCAEDETYDDLGCSMYMRNCDSG